MNSHVALPLTAPRAGRAPARTVGTRPVLVAILPWVLSLLPGLLAPPTEARAQGLELAMGGVGAGVGVGGDITGITLAGAGIGAGGHLKGLSVAGVGAPRITGAVLTGFGAGGRDVTASSWRRATSGSRKAAASGA